MKRNSSEARETTNNVFIGLKDVAYRYSSLQVGMKRIGIESDFCSIFWEKTPASIDRGNRFFYRARVAHKNMQETHAQHLRFFMWVRQRFWSTLALFSVALKYKVFLFSYCTTFLPWGLDILFLRAIGRRVVLYAGHGSDTRPKFFQGPHEALDSVAAASKFILREKIRSVRIGFMTRMSTITISTLPVDHYIKGSYVESFWLGIPSVSGEQETQNNPDIEAQGITYSHQPSRASLKGTQQILEYMSGLGVEMVASEPFVKIGIQEWVARSEVQKIMRRSDFYYDQDFLDIPSSVSGVEAGNLGKPVVYKGLGPKIYRLEYPEMVLPKLIHADTELPKLLASPDAAFKLARSGQELKTFLETNWEIELVSQRYVDVLFGNRTKEHWIRKPSRQYCLPMGLSGAEFDRRKYWLNRSPLMKLLFPKVWKIMLA